MYFLPGAVGAAPGEANRTPLLAVVKAVCAGWGRSAGLPWGGGHAWTFFCLAFERNLCSGAIMAHAHRCTHCIRAYEQK